MTKYVDIFEATFGPDFYKLSDEEMKRLIDEAFEEDNNWLKHTGITLLTNTITVDNLKLLEPSYGILMSNGTLIKSLTHKNTDYFTIITSMIHDFDNKLFPYNGFAFKVLYSYNNDREIVDKHMRIYNKAINKFNKNYRYLYNYKDTNGRYKIVVDRLLDIETQYKILDKLQETI